MKKYLLFTMMASTLVLGGCHKKHEAEKIIGGLPTDTSITVVPAQAAQQYILLNNDVSKTVINIINRLNNYASPTFPELTAIGGARYSFPVSHPRYGTATVVIQFQNNGSPIDPIATHTTTNTVTSLSIAVNTGVSSLFNYSESLTLTLGTAGDLLSRRTMTGSSAYTGSNQSLTFNIDSAGILSTTDGLTTGKVTATGTGTGGYPVNLSMNIDINHNANGTLTWEGQEGQIHFDPTVQGIVVTNTKRLLVP